MLRNVAIDMNLRKALRPGRWSTLLSHFRPTHPSIGLEETSIRSEKDPGNPATEQK